MHIRVLQEQRPIEPIRFVVLTVSVIVATLRSTDFIAHQEHGKAQREQRDGHEILYLAVSESLNFRIRSGALSTTVPTPIVVSAITVILTVGFVVFVIVRDQVIKRKSIVTGYEVN